MTDGRRAQLVLLAAAAIALAFVPVVAAYLQLGYHADVRADPGHVEPVTDANRALTHGVTKAAGDATASDWGERDSAVETIRAHLRPTVAAVENADPGGGVSEVAGNDSAAADWAANRCPNGPNRQFGPCEAHGELVVQERANRTHVVGAAFDVRITTPRASTRVTLLVGPDAPYG